MRFFIVSLILFFANLAFAAPSMNECRKFFLYPERTKELITYIESIADLTEVKTRLPEFSSALLNGSVENVISNQQARINPSLQVHRNGLQDLLNSSSFNILHLQKWVQEKLATTSEAKRMREEVEQQTVKALVRPHFIRTHQPLEKPTDMPHAILSPYPLEIMDTAVTQHMWAEHFKHNPSFFAKGEATIRADAPVESITFWSALFFANEMSRLKGLEPAYDFTDILFSLVVSGKTPFELAATGELVVISNSYIEKFLSRNSFEQVVKRPGYRIPTNDEFEILLRMLKAENGQGVYDLSKEQLQDYMLGQETVPSDETQPVRSLHPLFLDGQGIYDFIGNSISYTYSLIINSRGNYYVGGGGRTYSEQIVRLNEVKTQHNYANGKKYSFVGLRLVRSVVP